MKLRKFFMHLANIMADDGKKRVKYAIINIILMILTCVFAFIFYWLVSIQESVINEYGLVIWVFLWIGAVACLALGLTSFVQGFIAQFITLISSAVGVAKSQERSKNIAALVIASVSIVVIVVAFVVILFLIK